MKYICSEHCSKECVIKSHIVLNYIIVLKENNKRVIKGLNKSFYIIGKAPRKECPHTSGSCYI